LRNVITALLVSFCLASIVPQPVRAQEQASDAPAPSILTESDQRILDRGPYDRREIVVGGLVGTVIGFGSGHGVQSRYRRTGWIYTVGEVGSLGLFASAAACSGSWGCVYGLALSGATLFVGFRLVEAVDVWLHPAVHNRRYRNLKERTDGPQLSFRLEPILDGGAKLGFALRY
jgi:hypothetical protein